MHVQGLIQNGCRLSQLRKTTTKKSRPMSTDSVRRTRLNDTRLKPSECPRCHLPILTGWDNEIIAKQVRLHPATIDYRNMIAALYLGLEATEVTGSHETGFRADQTLIPARVQYFEFSTQYRTKKYMIPHTCGTFPKLTFDPIPEPEPDQPEEYDLFNQPTTADDLPPY